MVIDETFLNGHVDYFIRDAVKAINLIPGVETGDTCSGHVIGHHERGFGIFYIPGLQEFEGERIFNESGECVDLIPEHLEVGGKTVTRDDLVAGSTFKYKNDYAISPLDEIYRHNLDRLTLTPAGLSIRFWESDSHPRHRMLKNSLSNISKSYAGVLKSRKSQEDSYDSLLIYTPEIRFEGWPDEMDKYDGSEIAYWNDKKRFVCNRCKKIYNLWRNIELACCDILGVEPVRVDA
jgi:hypothetical protein